MGSNYYDQIADIYDNTRALPPEIDRQVTECILQLVAATPETKFLELDIGTGLNALPIINRGYAYTGVDISPQMLAQLRRKLPDIPPNLQLIQAEAASLPMLDNNAFDVALMRHMLHLVSDWRSCLAEIRRVLQPQGIYLYCESLWTAHQIKIEQQWQAILDQYKPPRSNLKVAKHSRAEKREVIQLLKAQGAIVESVVAAKWQVEQTVGELLDIYQTKDHGSCWSIPNDTFPAAMQEFRRWCKAYYGIAETVVLSSEAKFEITVARHWAR